LDGSLIERDTFTFPNTPDIFVFILGPLHPFGIPAGLCLQLKEGDDILDEVPTFARLRIVLCYLLLIELLNFEYEVTALDSDPHFVHDPTGCQIPLRAGHVTALFLTSQLFACPAETK
jgi:hypothetical protein